MTSTIVQSAALRDRERTDASKANTTTDESLRRKLGDAADAATCVANCSVGANDRRTTPYESSISGPENLAH